MRGKIVIGLAMVMLALGIALASSFGDGQPIVKTSADGNITLTIPQGALPEGVTADSIKIARVEKDESLHEGDADDEKPATYELSPSGLTLLKPATITLSFEAGNEGKVVPFVLHASGEGEDAKVEVVETAIGYDPAKKSVFASGEISHFSEIEVYLGGLWKEKANTGHRFEHNVGDTFNVYLRVEPTGNIIKHVSNSVVYLESYGVSAHPVTYYQLLPGSSWSIQGKVHTRRGIVNPEEATISQSGLGETQAFEVNQPFTCVKAGVDDVYATPSGMRVEYRLKKSYAFYVPARGWNQKEGKYENSRNIVSDKKPDDERGLFSASVYETHECKAVEEVQAVAVAMPDPKTENVAVGTLDTESGAAALGDKKYYKVTSEDKARDTGNEVCAAVGKSCVGYTDFSLGSCLAFHPGANQNSDMNGSKAGFYCNGAPQGGVCAQEPNTCHICPNCRVNMDCSMEIGILYRETYVECQ